MQGSISPSIMKLVVGVLVLVACAGSALGQINSPLASVRRDFREASVVVRMNITDTRRIERGDGYLYQFIASGEVTASYKGRFKKGQRLEYYTHAEEGIDHNDRRGDYIAFLIDRRNGGLRELTDGNSVFPYSQERLAQVRTVWREWRRRKTRD